MVFENIFNDCVLLVNYSNFIEITKILLWNGDQFGNDLVLLLYQMSIRYLKLFAFADPKEIKIH